MESNQSSMTALVASFARAFHRENDTPVIFDDPVARQLLSDGEYAQIAGYLAGGLDFFAPEKKADLSDPKDAVEWVVQTQLAPTPLARARYCEEMLENAIMLGAKQYVILGAGMDTFAYRIPAALSKLDVFEVDHPATQAFKTERVKRAGLTAPEGLHTVAMDFSKDSLADHLRGAGFDPQKRTFFSWLGVSYYLTPAQNSALLKSVAALAPAGSGIVFDYAQEGLFTCEVRRVRSMVAMAAAGGEPMRCCYSLSALQKTLEDAGLLLYEHLTPPEIEARFFAGREDALHAFEQIAFTLAVVKNK